MNLSMNDSGTMLKIALPKRGRIADDLGPLCREAGYEWPASSSSRALFARISNNIEVMFVRTKDVATVVADGVVDLGITGTDLVQERGNDVQILETLGLFNCRMVLAGPPEWHKVFRNNRPQEIRIATSFPNMAKAWGENAGINVDIISLSGSIEIAPRLGIADAIIDLTQSGATMRSNGLEEIETICDVEACVVGAQDFDINSGSTKAYEARTFVQSLVSVLNAKGKRYVMMNVPKAALDEVRDLVPGLASPTVIDLYGVDDTVALHVVIEKDYLNTIIPQLQAKGVHGILVSHIERLIP